MKGKIRRVFYLKLIIFLGLLTPAFVLANEGGESFALSRALLKAAVVKKDLPTGWESKSAPKKAKDLAHYTKTLLENADVEKLSKLFDHPDYAEWKGLYNTFKDPNYKKLNNNTPNLTTIDIVNWLDETKKYVLYLMPAWGKADATDALYYLPFLIDKALLKIYTGCWGISPKAPTAQDRTKLIEILNRIIPSVRLGMVDKPLQEKDPSLQQKRGHFQVIENILNSNISLTQPYQRLDTLFKDKNPKDTTGEKDIIKAVLFQNLGILTKNLQANDRDYQANVGKFLVKTLQGLQPYPQQEKKILDRLTASFLKTKEFIVQTPKPKLILGVNAADKANHTMFDNSCVFLDINQDDEKNPRGMKANFNSLWDLFLLSKVFPSAFDQIILDHSTFKFTEWTTEHLKYFRDMLKPHGEFVFGPSITLALGQNSFNSWQEAFNFIIKDQNIEKTHSLIVSYTMPLPLPPPVGTDLAECQQEINQLIQQYQSLKKIDPGKVKQAIQQWDWANKLNATEDWLLEQDEDGFKTFITQRIYQSSFQKKFMTNFLVPKNYQRIMEEVFGKNQVEITYDKPLPFRKESVESVLIKAVKKG